MAKTIRPRIEDINKALEAASRLDIVLTDTRWGMRERSKMWNRIADMVDTTRELRRALSDMRDEVEIVAEIWEELEANAQDRQSLTPR